MGGDKGWTLRFQKSTSFQLALCLMDVAPRCDLWATALALCLPSCCHVSGRDRH